VISARLTLCADTQGRRCPGGLEGIAMELADHIGNRFGIGGKSSITTGPTVESPDA
jgi:hypothetical protein